VALFKPGRRTRSQRLPAREVIGGGLRRQPGAHSKHATTSTQEDGTLTLTPPSPTSASDMRTVADRVRAPALRESDSCYTQAS